MFQVCVDWCVDCKCVCVLWLNQWPLIVTLPWSRKQLTEKGRVDNDCPVNVNWDVGLVRRSLVLNEALAVHGTYANIQVNLPPLVCVIVNQGLLGPPWTKGGPRDGGQADRVSNLTVNQLHWINHTTSWKCLKRCAQIWWFDGDCVTVWTL